MHEMASLLKLAFGKRRAGEDGQRMETWPIETQDPHHRHRHGDYDGLNALGQGPSREEESKPDFRRACCDETDRRR